MSDRLLQPVSLGTVNRFEEPLNAFYDPDRPELGVAVPVYCGSHGVLVGCVPESTITQAARDNPRDFVVVVGDWHADERGVQVGDSRLMLAADFSRFYEGKTLQVTI